MITKYKKTKKGSWQTVFFSVLMGSLFLTIVGFLTVSNFKISQKRAQLTSQIEQLKEQIIDLEAKKQELGTLVNQSTSSDYLEKQARETFNLQKPGEEVVIVLPQGEEPQPEQKIKQWWNPLTW